jgi:hypothetical protein
MCIRDRFILVLSSGVKIEAEFLLKNFGASKGMIVVNKYDIVANHTDEIVNEGYGLSVLDEPFENEQYSRDDYIEILSDWGWSGEKDKMPNWL